MHTETIWQILIWQLKDIPPNFPAIRDSWAMVRSKYNKLVSETEQPTRDLANKENGKGKQ